MHHFRHQQPDASRMGLAVVPVEETAAKCPGVLDGAEPLGKRRPLLHCLELTRRVRMAV
jgi:hypothetical protein